MTAPALALASLRCEKCVCRTDAQEAARDAAIAAAEAVLEYAEGGPDKGWFAGWADVLARLSTALAAERKSRTEVEHG